MHLRVSLGQYLRWLSRFCYRRVSRRLKISDFGLSQALKKRGQGKQEFSAGSMLWLDPVAQEAQLVGSFSDVYSFGICMWELAAWALPYMNLLKEGVQGVGIAQRALRGERPIAIEGGSYSPHARVGVPSANPARLGLSAMSLTPLPCPARACAPNHNLSTLLNARRARSQASRRNTRT